MLSFLLSFLQTILYFPFLNLLTFFIWLVPGHNAVWGIIALTLTVRLILILPTKRAAQAQRKLAEMQPLIEELKKEYGDDREGLAAAQMNLYKENGINPFASCGLAMVQLPILYILYFSILHGLTPNNPHLYSWTPRPPFIGTDFFGLNLLHPDPTYVIPIIAAALQFVQMRLTMPKPAAGSPSDPSTGMQRQMAFIFPLLTLAIAYRFPAGVVVYWVISTLFSIVQQAAVNKERLKLKGVEKALEAADHLHPEKASPHSSVEAELADVNEDKQTLGTSTKKGVSVTVRRKKK